MGVAAIGMIKQERERKNYGNGKARSWQGTNQVNIRERE